MAKQLLDPTQIIFIQARAAMNEDVIDEYTVLMKDGVQFDPASGILDEAAGQVYVWDGSHRGAAAKRLRQRLAVSLEPGTREEAEWLALTANQKHGLRRSRADKQQAIRQALRHPRGANLSNSEIARHCGVDHKTVGRIRTEMETSGEIPRITERVVTRNGVTYRQDTAKLNNFVSLPELEQAVASAVAQETGDVPARIELLAEIKRGTPSGEEKLTQLREQLPAPHRRRDVLAVCADMLARLRQEIRLSHEGQCPHCLNRVYYAPDLGYLFCESCEARWPHAQALTATSLTDIDRIIRTTLEADDPKWNKARHSGLTDPQLRDRIAQRWGRGSGQVNPTGVGYWVAGYPTPALWVGNDVLDQHRRGEVPTLDGEELLTAVRAALRLPYGLETRYCRQCGTKAKLLADAADAARPTSCPGCGASEAGLWLKNPPADKSSHQSPAPANGTAPASGQHSYILEEDQPQPCPECGEQRVRGVNGSQRWCIGCGANWPTAAAFLADVAAVAAPITTRRAELTRRFAEVVRLLSPAQLSEVEAVIIQLETQSSQ